MALEPITRKEQIIAGKDLEPITRMEKFLKEYGGGSGGGADWNANEGEAGHVKNRTHYESIETVNEPLNITWDGNTEGLVSAEGASLYKVSNFVLADAQMRTATFTLNNGTNASLSTIWDGLASNGLANEEVAVVTGFLALARKDNAILNGIVFPEAGIYFAFSNARYTASLTTTEPVPQTKTVVHKLDKKYLPDDIGGGGDIFFVTYSTDLVTGEAFVDKTYEEAVAAYNERKYVVLKEEVLANGELFLVMGYSSMTTCNNDNELMFTIRDGADGGIWTRIFHADNTITAENYTNINHAKETNGSGIVMKSSTTNSDKYFRIQVDDSGTLTATELT